MQSQGPPDVGNLTMCKYSVLSAGSSAQADAPTSTKWIPETVNMDEVCASYTSM